MLYREWPALCWQRGGGTALILLSGPLKSYRTIVVLQLYSKAVQKGSGGVCEGLFLRWCLVLRGLFHYYLGHLVVPWWENIYKESYYCVTMTGTAVMCIPRRSSPFHFSDISEYRFWELKKIMYIFWLEICGDSLLQVANFCTHLMWNFRFTDMDFLSRIAEGPSQIPNLLRGGTDLFVLENSLELAKKR